MIQAAENPLAKDFDAGSLIRFAFPSMVMMLFMGLYTVTDTIFVARFVDTNALSAVNIVCPVINLMVGLGTMLAAGGSAVVARKMGDGKTEEARSDFTWIVAAGVMAGLVITAVGLFFLEEIIRGLGASEVLFPYCRDYLAVQFLFAVGNLLQVLYQNLFVTAGKPALGLTLAVLAGILNLVLDYVFIVFLHMGIRGAAVGTGIGYMIPATIGTIFFLTKRSELYFCRPQRGAFVLRESCANGVSEMVSQCSTAVTTFLFNVTMMKLSGEDGVAAITVLLYAQFFFTALSIGFSMGVAPVISYHYGNRNEERLRKIVRICFCFLAGISAGVFLFSLFGAQSLAGVFAGKNQKVFEMTKDGFGIFSFSFLFSGYNIFSSALFTALSNGKASAAISFLRTFAGITVFLLVLPRFLKVTGVWLAVPLAEGFTFMLTVFLIGRRRKRLFVR